MTSKAYRFQLGAILYFLLSIIFFSWPYLEIQERIEKNHLWNQMASDPGIFVFGAGSKPSNILQVIENIKNGDPLLFSLVFGLGGGALMLMIALGCFIRYKANQNTAYSNYLNSEKGGRNMSEKEHNGSVGTGIGWMFIISVLLFWLPLIGPFIAGVVGGKKSGELGNAIMAVFLPAIVFGLFLFAFASTLSGLPLIGAIAGAGGFLLCMVHIGPLLLGAIIGGAIA